MGCGTLGASLSFGFARSGLVSDLKIYDFDYVSKFSETVIYPFLLSEGGIPKVRVVKFNANYINPDMMVLAHQEKIDNPISTKSFVIDCRDCKHSNIGAKVRFSLDGHMLYIDSMSYSNSEYDYHHYVIPRSPQFIEKAVGIILEYLKDDLYIYKDFRFYDLRNDELHILKRENFHGGYQR